MKHSMTTAEFISELFKHTEMGIYFSSLSNERDLPGEPNERHILTRDIAATENFIANWDRSPRGLYLCVSTITGKRSKANAIEIPALYTDVDFRGSVSTEEEIRGTLASGLRCRPSMRVHSGRGLHAWWILKEPIVLPDARAGLTERVEAVLRQLADHVGGDLAVAEVSRLMRLPGTHNTKDGQSRLCVVEECTGARYELDDIEEWLAETAPVLRRRPAGHAATGGQSLIGDVPDNPFIAAAKLLGFKPPVDVEARLTAMVYGGAGDAGIHSTQLSVSASLLSAGQGVQEVVDILIEATRAAAGELGERWNWRREEQAIAKMCATWLAKHPPGRREKPPELLELPDRPAVKVTTPKRTQPAPEPASVTDISEARAARKPKAEPKGKQKKHTVVAEALLAAMQERGERLLFTPNGAYSYTDSLWRLRPDKVMRADIEALAEECCVALSLQSSNSLINEVRNYIFRQPRLRMEDPPFDRHGMVPVPGGLVDPRSGSLTPAAPEHYCTWRVAPQYQPGATCSIWLQMLDGVFADRTPEARTACIWLLQELLGLGLIDQRPKDLSKALILEGGSNHGKSGLLDVMAGLFGSRVNTAPLDSLENAHALMPFAERVPWVLHEAFNQSTWHMSSTVKAIVSGDAIQINLKGGALYSHRVTAPIFWGSNNPPQFKEATDAIVNRLVVIACQTKFDAANPVGAGILAREARVRGPAELVLRDEMGGVLVWALEGLKRALERGWLILPEESRAAADEIRRESNIVAGFIEDCCEYDCDRMVSVADFCAAFALWWETNKGEAARSHSRVSIGKAVHALGDRRIASNSKEVRDNSRRYYAGIALNTEGVKMWNVAVVSTSFKFKDRFSDATPADGNPNEDIPGGWNERPAIKTMRFEAARFGVTGGFSGRDRSDSDLSPVVTEKSPVTDLSPDLSSSQAAEPSDDILF